jgi:hypothetical protein
MSPEPEIANSTSEVANGKSRKGIGGPKTPEGRRRVSANAVRHGYYAKTEQAMEILKERVGRSFEELHAALRDHFKPTDALEDILVRRIARAAWRTMLAEAAENAELAIHTGGMPVMTRGYDNMLRNERLIDIQLHRALFALERKRESHKKLQNKLNLTPLLNSIL